MARTQALGRRLLCVCTLMAMTLSASACTLKPGKSPERLTYRLPTTLTIPVGRTLPGTDIQYQAMSDKGAHVLIGGQTATKRKGDSLDWRGQPIPGVDVDLQLRVVWYTEEELRVAGVAKVVLSGTSPHVAVVSTSSPMVYSGPVVYSLGKGATLPGSTITFEGASDEGALLGGLEGYPYRQIGDSLSWEGILREGVFLRLEMRVIQYDDKGLRIGGIARLWLGH